MKRIFKEWGGWITFCIYGVISIAVYFSAFKNMQEDQAEIKETLHEIRDFMDKQLELNGKIIQYMVMDSE